MQNNPPKPQMKLSKNIIVFVILLIIVIYVSMTYLSKHTQSSVIIETSAKPQNVIESSKEVSKDTIQVYLTGEVNQPGIYTVSKGEILGKVIEMGKGLKQTADKENVNLVFKLDSNMMIKIKSTQEIEAQKNLLQSSHDAENGIEVTTSAGNGVDIPSQKLHNEFGSNHLININSATESELDSLPGIGSSTAKKIIEYRVSHGPFQSVEDLRKVQGIGNTKFKRLKDLITVTN